MLEPWLLMLPADLGANRTPTEGGAGGSQQGLHLVEASRTL